MKGSISKWLRGVCLAMAIAGAGFSQDAISQEKPAADAILEEGGKTDPVTVETRLDEDGARISLEAEFRNAGKSREPEIYGAALRQVIRVSSETLQHSIEFKARAIQGGLRTIVFAIAGEGEIKGVTGEGIEDWSVRQGSDGKRVLVVRARGSKRPATVLEGLVKAETRLAGLPAELEPMTLTLENEILSHGYARVDADAGIEVEVRRPRGAAPVAPEYLPEEMREQTDGAARLGFRFSGTAYALPMRVGMADPEALRVVVKESRLAGHLSAERADFIWTGVARVKNPRGGKLALLGGAVGLTEAEAGADARIHFEEGRFWAVFEKAGEFPLRIRFEAAVGITNDWRAMDFQVASSALQPVILRGLAADTQLRVEGAARTERDGDAFASFLPADGRVKLAWKGAPAEAEGALFYSVEQLSQIVVSPGLLRQTARLQYKVMQGELKRIAVLLRGAGEVTRVLAPQVLSWRVEPGPGAEERRLVAELNEPQRDSFAVLIQIQEPLGVFPQEASPVELRDEGATRFGGFFQVVNEGAVRLEVVDAGGLSQLSPEQMPRTEEAKAVWTSQGAQRFYYRFAGGAYRLRMRADNILPEVGVSEVLVYRLGETELTIDADLELDVREAPLRELAVRAPRGWSLVRLTGSGVTDYSVSDVENTAEAEVRVLFGVPVLGRQLLQMQLERNAAWEGALWTLPRIEVLKAKSVRGHVGIASEAGFRLAPVSASGLTEAATGFFPKKTDGLQAAYRLNEGAWTAALTVERLPQALQADVFHLFSVGEGIAYGSTLVNYAISGAPVGVLRVGLTSEYFNVEFTGKDIRNWQKADGGYVVQLHAPVAGTYTLLATYERPFNAQGATLRFAGAQPLEVTAERGHTVVVSANQFQIQPVTVSGGLTSLDPGEVPAEYRLFFDAPILAAYRYQSRPFDLELALKPLAQGETVSQLVERAALTTRISKEGQVVTDARYFLKSRGAPFLGVNLPQGMQLWAVTVNGERVVPVSAGAANRVPLPQQADPNAVLDVEIKAAAKAGNPRRLNLGAPLISAPVLLSEWKVMAETGQRLKFRAGTLTPADGEPDRSGFARIFAFWRKGTVGGTWGNLGSFAGLLGLGVFLWRSAAAEGVKKYDARHLTGGVLGLMAFGLGLFVLFRVGGLIQGEPGAAATELRFIAPIQPAESLMTIEVVNAPLEVSGWERAGGLWPLVLALGLWGYGWAVLRGGQRALARGFGWVLIAWGALRAPEGASVFMAGLGAFVLVELLAPLVKRWRAVPRAPEGGGSGGSLSAPAAAVLMIGFMGGMAEARGAETSGLGMRLAAEKQPALAESVTQEVEVRDKQVSAAVKIEWRAREGQALPILKSSGVLTRIQFEEGTARLIQIELDGQWSQGLFAEKTGLVKVEMNYEAQIDAGDRGKGFYLPVHHGLVNRMNLNLAGQDADLAVSGAISVARAPESPRREGEAGARFEVVLPPATGVWVGIQPRARDPRREKPLFHAEWFQLAAPNSGVLEGWHSAHVRPAQGELAELVFAVPSGMTITDVSSESLDIWRFDPSARKLRVSLRAAQSRPFSVRIKSQEPTRALPLEHAAGLISLDEAASEVGSLGIATSPEVQLDEVKAERLSSMNLEDFPDGLVEAARGEGTELTLRRAFRYSEAGPVFTLRASAVEPDVRVSSQQTVSLGEDRTLVAADLAVSIARAGIFRLSFALPNGYAVESLSGAAMSHWTELQAEGQRVVTAHLKTRTEGSHNFSVTLTGPGPRAAQGWETPRVRLREAGKEQGQLVLVPEQGMRLQAAAREAVAQLDPLQAGVRQKGVLVFRLLQSNWRLVLDVERVEAWTQVWSWQQIAVNEAGAQVAGHLQYEIENAGVRTLKVRLPASAENVRFAAELFSDSVAQSVPGNPLVRDWEIKLSRRAAGRLSVRVNYALPLAEGATNMVVTGVEAREVHTQRGFLSLRSSGRLQATAGQAPGALQAAEWESVPRTLRPETEAGHANQTFRVADPVFELPLRIERHEAARVLAARVTDVLLTTALSDDGAALTHAKVTLIPGDKPLLRLRLPAGARFWSAFVGQNSVWPWLEGESVLIPLEGLSDPNRPSTVEFFYGGRAGSSRGNRLGIDLAGPRFDLPLENIQWRLFVNDKWEVRDWSGSLRLQDQQAQPSAAADLSAYFQAESSAQREKTQEAEQFLSKARQLLEQGDPGEARRAFRAAYGLSQHDNAFNEDARVQLHNLKTQQALVGLNVRQAKMAGNNDALAAAPRNLRDGRSSGYTQQEAKQLMDRNSAEEHAAQSRLVERLVQQQEAMAAHPTMIRASIPEQGRLLTFARALQVETEADLRIDLDLAEKRSVTSGQRLGLMFALAAGGLGLAWCARRRGEMN